MPEAPTPAAALRAWIDAQARERVAALPLPRSASEAAHHAERIRRRMREAERHALLPEGQAPPLDPQVLRTLERDGYRIELLTFQSRPGVAVTATAYVPTAGRGPYPAVLCVHGHWAGARRDPVVQARCIGLARLGFFAMTLDAWGAGERGTVPGRNEYHGGLLGASLWPVGTPLHGLQLQDNIRALDYLQSRPEVDPARIGCTGASGGGNQTTYLSAFDERVRCAVPVCSVGTFVSYLNTACCVDEVLLGALTFAEEGDLLGLVAPRALMVITAARDSYHFGPEAARQALDRTRAWFRAWGAEDRVRHVVIDSGHDYNQSMREAMYGWMTLWLKGEGDGSPIPEPPIRTEDPEALRCFPPEARPPRVMTTVRWVRERALERAAQARFPAEPDALRPRLERLRAILTLPAEATAEPLPLQDGAEAQLTPEPGVLVPIRGRRPPGERPAPVALLAHPMGRKAALETSLAEHLRAAGIATAALDLRGCGELTLPNQSLRSGLPDHNLVEWSLWIGRPLLGQWVHDLIHAAAAIAKSPGADGRRLILVGWREAALAALLAAALSERFRGVAALELLATFTTEGPPHELRMVVFQPDLLEVGDVPQLAALPAPRRVLVANPVRLDGMPADAREAGALFAETAAFYARIGRRERFALATGADDGTIARTLRSWLA